MMTNSVMNEISRTATNLVLSTFQPLLLLYCQCHPIPIPGASTVPKPLLAVGPVALAMSNAMSRDPIVKDVCRTDGSVRVIISG